MKIKEIKDLIKFLSLSNLEEVNLETSELKLSIKKAPQTERNISRKYDTGMHSLPAHGRQEVISLQQIGEAKVEPKPFIIKSPMIGTFYSSQSPDSSPFVKIGDKITKGQKLCIIEAMKLFNDIESEIDGTVIDILVENISPVEYDQELFLVAPNVDIEL